MFNTGSIPDYINTHTIEPHTLTPSVLYHSKLSLSEKMFKTHHVIAMRSMKSVQPSTVHLFV